eukprot:GSChrysophyteH1.ASY1.ANO1.2492.1 assembled CDS
MDYLKKFDAFPKALDDFRVRTRSGAIVSILAMVLMLILFISELNYFMQVETIDYLYVDSRRSQNLHVSFDFSFPEVPCGLLTIEAMDDMNEVQEKLEGTEIYKHRLDILGNKAGDTERHELGDALKKKPKENDFAQDEKRNEALVIDQSDVLCGNCYGAANKGVCCNSCNDVRVAYNQRGWLFKPQEVSQCRTEAIIETMRDGKAVDGGCQIYGTLELGKSAGHFHIAPHRDIHDTNPTSKDQVDGLSLLDLLQLTFAQFNITHTVNSLNFGRNFPGFKSPLDGQSRTVLDTHGMYQYYIKIVPTKYQKENEIIESNQYAVTEHLRHLAPGSGRGLPGVYFNYEISPVQAVYEEKTAKLTSFVTSLCAILGGLYVVMGVIDSGISALSPQKHEII